MNKRWDPKALIRRFRSRRILVVGDLMLDRYVSGTVARISPEAPVPVVRVVREQARPISGRWVGRSSWPGWSGMIQPGAN